jgi:plastocyanin
MKQHNVAIKSCAGKFEVPDPELVIDVGDMVLWNCNDANALPFAVVGDHEFFSSNRLVNECGFSHAFGIAGDYHWVDVHGSGASGIVRVRDPGCKNEADLKRWRQMVAKGTLVTISDGRAEPSDVEIVTGQTIFFMVVKGPGISITDAQLLSGSTQRKGDGKGEATSPQLGKRQRT